MKTLNINLHRHLRFAAAILAMGFLTIAGSAHAGDNVPIKGTLTGSFVGGDPDAGLFVAELSGKVSHLGKTTVTVVVDSDDLQFVDCEGNSTNDPSCFALSEEGFLMALATIPQTVIFKAANGDELWVTQQATGFVIILAPPGRVGAFPETLIDATITGGTGRFENATGSYTASGRQIHVEGGANDLLETSFEGTISTVGSRGGNGNE